MTGSSKIINFSELLRFSKKLLSHYFVNIINLFPSWDRGKLVCNLWKFYRLKNGSFTDLNRNENKKQ